MHTIWIIHAHNYTNAFNFVSLFVFVFIVSVFSTNVTFWSIIISQWTTVNQDGVVGIMAFAESARCSGYNEYGKNIVYALSVILYLIAQYHEVRL